MNRQKREKLICDAAVAVFARHGYGKASVSEIIREACMARGTFYLYYKNKGEIFDAILERFLSDIAKSAFPNPESPQDGPAKAFRALGRELSTALTHNRLLARIILSESRRLDLFMDRLSALIARYLDETAKNGNLRDCRVDVVSHCLVGSLREVISRWILRDGFEMEAAIGTCVDFFLNGLIPVSLSLGTVIPEEVAQTLTRPPFSNLH